jgi:hypothetical protein
MKIFYREPAIFGRQPSGIGENLESICRLRRSPHHAGKPVMSKE